MYGQSDEAIRASLRKLYGSVRSLTRGELRRRLRMTPEFFYFTDQIVEQAVAHGVLRARRPQEERSGEFPALDIGGEDEPLEIAD